MENRKFLCIKNTQVGNRLYKAGEDTINGLTYNTLTSDQQQGFKPFPDYLSRMEKERDSQYKVDVSNNPSTNSWDDLAGR
jgi:hypothetical protein